MSTQHLSDEAIAAFADGVLAGHARDRASRHTSRCPECAHAVAVQREAIWALRAAPAPSLPGGLLDRLRSVPQTTPIRTPPTVLGPDGSAMFAAFGTPLGGLGAAALVPTKPGHHNKALPVAMTAAAVAVAGVLAVGSSARTNTTPRTPTQAGTARVNPALFDDPGPIGADMASVRIPRR